MSIYKHDDAHESDGIMHAQRAILGCAYRDSKRELGFQAITVAMTSPVCLLGGSWPQILPSWCHPLWGSWCVSGDSFVFWYL